MTYSLKFFLVVLCVAFADICWTYYMIKVEERKALAAGLWSCAIMGFGAFSVMSYAEDKSMVIAAVIGAFLGTAGTVYYKKRKENKL